MIMKSSVQGDQALNGLNGAWDITDGPELANAVGVDAGDHRLDGGSRA